MAKLKHFCVHKSSDSPTLLSSEPFLLNSLLPFSPAASLLQANLAATF